jgi:hypothetical protein
LGLSFVHLDKLSLGHNAIKVFPSELHPILPALTELRINNNLISEIPLEFISNYSKKLKILDLSSNLLSEWNEVEKLSGLNNITNLSLKGNPLPALPATVESVYIKEDVSAPLITDANEKRYRINVLNIFQRRVGALQKHFVQLVVLDNKRVKTKWTQGGAHRQGEGNLEVEQSEHHDPSLPLDNAAVEITGPNLKIAKSNNEEISLIESALKASKKSKKEKKKSPPLALDIIDNDDDGLETTATRKKRKFDENTKSAEISSNCSSEKGKKSKKKSFQAPPSLETDNIEGDLETVQLEDIATLPIKSTYILDILKASKKTTAVVGRGGASSWDD